MADSRNNHGLETANNNGVSLSAEWFLFVGALFGSYFCSLAIVMNVFADSTNNIVELGIIYAGIIVLVAVFEEHIRVWLFKFRTSRFGHAIPFHRVIKAGSAALPFVSLALFVAKVGEEIPVFNNPVLRSNIKGTAALFMIIWMVWHSIAIGSFSEESNPTYRAPEENEDTTIHTDHVKPHFSEVESITSEEAGKFGLGEDQDQQIQEEEKADTSSTYYEKDDSKFGREEMLPPEALTYSDFSEWDSLEDREN